ncbi:MAG: DUF1559 domain-containing protein [Armatimonadetes bacterium]|nr:DUF1559 domain-containing protein [Armatimonadota bacterium]
MSGQEEPDQATGRPADNEALTCGIAACVVVAIVAVGLATMMVMAAIMFPAFVRAREKARQASCISNLKQLDLAMLMYAQDYDEVLPLAHSWCDATLAYTRDRSVYVCPNEPRAQGTYALNDGVAGWNLSAIVSPAETVGIFESRPGWNLCGGPQLIECRHNEGANVGFVNGYVKWVNGGSVSSLTWVPEIVPYTGYR